MSQFLWALSTLNSLNIEVSNPSLWQTNKLDILLPHLLRSGVERALSNWLLGDTDLILLVDEGVSLGCMADCMFALKDRSGMCLLCLILDTFFFLRSNIKQCDDILQKFLY